MVKAADAPISPVRRQRKLVTVTAPEKQEIKIETISNVEELSVKAKIKMMDSFVGTNPIQIDKSNNERSASTSSTDSRSSTTSSAASKSPLISPK